MRRMDISIHAPREGSDFVVLLVMVIDKYFNPRSPRGERLFTVLRLILGRNFNPRSPRGERP